jgi:hypothetical protein
VIRVENSQTFNGQSGVLSEVFSPGCPGDRVLTGGGAFLLSPSPEASDGFVLRRSYPRFGFVPEVWAVQAVILGPPFLGDYVVTSYALCILAS